MLKRISLFFFFFYSFIALSQSEVTIDSLFKKEQITSKLSYVLDASGNASIDTIKTKAFKTFNNQFFPGLYNKKFWFKIDLSNASNTDVELFYKIKSYVFYNSIAVYKVLNSETKKLYENKEHYKREYKFPITVLGKEKATYFFEVEFYRAVSFPIELMTAKENQKMHINATIYQSVYYGFFFMVLVINVLFFIYTKSRFFIYYCLLQIGVVGSIAFLDGIWYFVFDSLFLKKFINVFLNLVLSIATVQFLSHAINLKKEFPLFKAVAYPLIGFSIIFFSAYMITKNNFWSGYGKICYLSTLLFCYLTAIYFIKRSVYARFYVLAFSVLCVCHILFILPITFGLRTFGFTEWHYKIGSVVEMIIFLIAIPYRYKSLSETKDKIAFNLEVYKNQLKVQQEKESSTKNDKIEHLKSKFSLSEREVEIIEAIIEGKTNKDIANDLFLSEATIKYHCSKLYKKLKVKNRNQVLTLFNNI